MSILKITNADRLADLTGHDVLDIESCLKPADINRLHTKARNWFLGTMFATLVTAFGAIAIQQKADLPYIPGEGLIALSGGAAAGAALAEKHVKPEIDERIKGPKLPGF